MVAREFPLNWAVELDIKLVPVMVIVTLEQLVAGGDLQTGVLEGLSERIVGSGFETGLIVNVTAFDIPPPGAGLTTITCATPGLAISDAGTVAES